MKTYSKIAHAFCATLLLANISYGQWIRIDDFQGVSPEENMVGVNGWTATSANSLARVLPDPQGQGNRAVRLQRQRGVNSLEHDILFQTGALNVKPGGKATVFLRFLVETGKDPRDETSDRRGPISLKIALSKGGLNAGNPSVMLWVQGGVICTGESPTVAPDSPKIQRDRWYRLWMVVDNMAGSEKNSVAHLQEEGSTEKPAVIPGSIVVSKDHGEGVLDTVGVVKSRDHGLTDVWLDDLYVDNHGENLTNPTTNP